MNHLASGQLPLSGGPPQKLTKKRRDPNAPKAVSNAYMIFCKARRGELKQENPELPFGKIGAKLGEIWRMMTPEEKKPYEDRATVDRERYRKEMLDYQTGKHAVASADKKLKSEGGGAGETGDGEGDEGEEGDGGGGGGGGDESQEGGEGVKPEGKNGESEGVKTEGGGSEHAEAEGGGAESGDGGGREEADGGAKEEDDDDDDDDADD